MARIRAQPFAFKIVVASVDGDASSARKTAQTRLDGQITRLRLPPIVEAARSTDGGTISATVSARGLDGMSVEMDTPAAAGDFRKIFGRDAQLQIFYALKLAAKESDGNFGFDREIHTVDGHVDSVDPGDLTPDGDAIATIRFLIDGEYEIQEKAQGAGSDSVQFKTDTTDYVLQTGPNATDDLYENLSAALTA